MLHKKPRVTLVAEDGSKASRASDAKRKIAARRGTMMPPKKSTTKPRSTYKTVYQWWQKASIKYATGVYRLGWIGCIICNTCREHKWFSCRNLCVHE